MTTMVELPIDPKWSDRDKRALRQLVRDMQSPDDAAAAALTFAGRAALFVLRDLRAQGWQLSWARTKVEAAPPDTAVGVEAARLRVQSQERLKRDEQLRRPSVRRFIERMEAPTEHQGRFVSIANLMRDGSDLLDAIIAQRDGGEAAVRPYLQFPTADDRCTQTGLRLLDIWRYFRLTWSNQYVSTPGRSMPILVRDHAAPDHPVVGIAALGSAIVQLAQRDEYLEWTGDAVIERMRAAPSSEAARWLAGRLNGWINEVYVVDLVADGLLGDDWRTHRSSVSTQELRVEAERSRQRHQRLGRKADFESLGGAGSEQQWIDRANTDLYRARRCGLLADLIDHSRVLAHHLPDPSAEGLEAALKSRPFEHTVRWVTRRAKAESVGTAIADLTVCGAIAPYNEVLGGKLVSALAVSPTVLRQYRCRYEHHASEIASSIAGRRVERAADLVFIGTTSLYGVGASQYNRISIGPEWTAWPADVRFRRLGRSRSFGTSHFASDTTQALADLAHNPEFGSRVKGIFGEGASPKMRRVREGLDNLGWDSNILLQHRRERLVYGVNLASNATDYLLGFDAEPEFTVDVTDTDDIGKLTEWWERRWMLDRAFAPQRIAALRLHRKSRPLQHGARVTLTGDND